MNENETAPASLPPAQEPENVAPSAPVATPSGAGGAGVWDTPRAEIAFMAPEVPAAPPVAEAVAETEMTLLVDPAAPPPTLTSAAASDLAHAVATAQRARSRAKANARGPRPSDLIEKKIIIRRDRWDALVHLTETLQSERAVKAEPAEVAAIVLEAGLGAIIDESRQAVPRVVKKAHKSHKAPKSKKAKAIKPTRAAPAKPRSFAAAEVGEIKGLVRGVRFDRAVQRTIALWLGAHAKGGSLSVPIEDLRALCKEFKVYDTANFAQNMKKDAAFFVEVRNREGDRLGYSLTPRGAEAVQGLLAVQS